MNRVKNVRNFFAKFVFSLFFVYIVLLGLINIFIASNKDRIESFLASKLDAEQVVLENVSNLPLVFLSSSRILIRVNDELSLEVEGIYFYYRFWNIFNGNFEKIPGIFSIDRVVFQGHVVEVKDYIQKISQKYTSDIPKSISQSIEVDSNYIQKISQKYTSDIPKSISQSIEVDSNYIQKISQKYASDIPKPIPQSIEVDSNPPNFSLETVNLKLIVKQIIIRVRAQAEFKNELKADNVNVTLNNNTISTHASIGLFSEWSNQVFLISSKVNIQGSFTNFSDLSGNLIMSVDQLNLGGLPIVEQPIHIDISLSNQKPQFRLINLNNQNIELDTEKFSLAINRDFKIEYDEFEEYKMLDYAFKTGLWNFKLSLDQYPDWNLNMSFSSKQHPDYGLKLTLNPTQNNKYRVLLDLKTHYFGAVDANLILDQFQKGVYPLPSGTANLDNVRFVIAGLVFSGNAFLNNVPGKNILNITAYNVTMNDGFIGNTAVRFEFPKGKGFQIHPVFMHDSAANVRGDIQGGTVRVDIEVLDVDGDFVVKNIKLPFFGLATSRYKGLITIQKEDRKHPVLVNGNITGYQDGEKQIEAVLDVEDSLITVPYFKFVAQDILLTGEVNIDADKTNTFVKIKAEAERGQLGKIPINVDVTVQKKNADVVGSIDEIVSFITKSDSVDTDFEMDFNGYDLKKIGLDGDLSGKLKMGFDTEGWNRFSIEKGRFKTINRNYHVSFDSTRLSNTTLISSNFAIGIDSELLKGSGYFVMEEGGGIGGAFNFLRGGSLSFITGYYTWKLNADIRDFRLDNAMSFPPIKQFIDRDIGITDVFLNMNFQIYGLYSNPDFTTQMSIESAGISVPFSLTFPEITKKGDAYLIKNLRLRSFAINLDSDISFDDTIDISGAIALYGNSFKSRFELLYSESNNFKILDYRFFRLFALSRKSLELEGQVRQTGDTILFLSQNPSQGIFGSVLLGQKNQWDLSLLTESVKINSSGFFQNDSINALYNIHFLLDKMRFSEIIRSMKGDIVLQGQVEGSLDTPIFSGNINLNNVVAQFPAIRNTLSFQEQQQIHIISNRVEFPQLIINAGREDTFTLDGFVFVGDKGIENADLSFTSAHESGTPSSLNWNVKLPYFSLIGKSQINYISLIGEGSDLTLGTDIRMQNMNVNINIGDVFSDIEYSENTNPALAFLSVLNFDISLSFLQQIRVTSQLFNTTLLEREKITVQGSLADNTVTIGGELETDRGTINYLNADLKIERGLLKFSKDVGDVYPFINIETVKSTTSIRNEPVDIYVQFQGKIPSVELSSISSTLSMSKSEIFNVLSGNKINTRLTGIGTSEQYNASTQLLGNSVEVAENAFFTAPLTKKIQQFIPIDSFEIKTDLLGNITRGLSTGGTVSGLNILHGSELAFGFNIPRVKNLQVRYNLRLESPENTGANSSEALTQVHHGGIEYIIPYRRTRFGLGLGVVGKTGAESENEDINVLLEFSTKYRW